jgi:phenylalanyl-tRNA synthetase beta chain
MPVITLSASDLKSLAGKPVPDDQLRAVLPLIKCDIESWEGDEIRVEVTPDRPDLLSTEGIARQLSYWLGIRRGLHGYIVSKPRISLTAEPVGVRPEIVAGSVRGVEFTDSMVRSIMQLQEAVDLTIGRDRIKTAIGVHDTSKVKPPFFYREVGPRDISFVPLGFSKEFTIEEILRKHPKGVQYRHVFNGSKTYPIITDRNDDVLSFPPIINGELSKVTPETTDIFLDITGFDQTPLNQALNILLSALDMRGGRIEAVKINNRSYPHLKARPVRIDTASVKRMLGVNLRDRDIRDCLERMGYGFDPRTSQALVPPYRADIMHPVDVIEDVAIAYGYNDFVPEVPRLPTTGRPDPGEEFALRLKELMVGLGFQEVINLSLSNPKSQFTDMGARNPGAVEIANPVSRDYTICRHWLLPSLLGNLSSNIHRRCPQRIFELGECLHPDPGTDTRTRNVRKLAAVTSHADAGFSEIMSIFNAFSEALPLELTIAERSHPSFIRGRCASVILSGREIGLLGEIHPNTLQNFGLKMPVAALETSAEDIWGALKPGTPTTKN